MHSVLKKVKFSDIIFLFRNNNFLIVWVAYIVGNIGLNIFYFTLIIQIFEHTGNNFIVGVFVGVMSIPSVFFGPVAGVCTDFFNRRTVLVFISTLRFVLTIIVFFTFNAPVLLFVVAFIIMTASQFFTPTIYSIIPDLVPEEHLTHANTLFTLTLYSSFLIGFVGAGPLLHYSGVNVTLLVVCISFFIATLLKTLLPSLNHHIGDGLRSFKEVIRAAHIIQQMHVGIEHIRSNPLLKVIIFQVAFIFAVERAIISLIPALATRLFNFSVADISYFMIFPLAVGTIIGAISIHKLKFTFSPTYIIRIGLLLDGVSLLLLPFYQGSVFLLSFFGFDTQGAMVIHIAVMALISGFADVLIIVTSQTFIQRSINTSYRGRVFALLYTAMNIVSIPTALIIGGMADIINIPLVMVVFSIMTFCVAFLGPRIIKIDRTIP